VNVSGYDDIVNADYWVACAEGVQATGFPVITQISKLSGIKIYLPIIWK